MSVTISRKRSKYRQNANLYTCFKERAYKVYNFKGKSELINRYIDI